MDTACVTLPHRASNTAKPAGSTFRSWVILFSIALTIRAGWGTYRMLRVDEPTRLEFPDEEQYWRMARSLREGDGLRDELGFRATRMPLYPGFLALFAETPRGVIHAKMVQWVIGALTATFSAAAASTFFGWRIGFGAGLLVALDPFLVFFSSLLLTEAVFTTALAALWWLLAPLVQRQHGGFTRWTLIGACGALCLYIRESSLGLVLLALGFIAAIRRCRGHDLIGAGIACGIIVASLVPWGYRNRQVVGEWCWLTTRGGISLYDGVGPQARGDSDLGDIKAMPAVRGLSEVEWNRFFLTESWRSLTNDPLRILRLAGVKLARMWNPLPNIGEYRSWSVRVVSAGWTLPLLMLAVAGACLLTIEWKQGEGPRYLVFLLLPALYFSALHSVFVGSVRYRLGAMPMIETLAAFAMARLWDRFARKQAREISEP